LTALVAPVPQLLYLRLAPTLQDLELVVDVVFRVVVGPADRGMGRLS
jgi:hypothetical protein